MISLHWREVHAWRLSQHSLMKRAARRQMLEVTKKIGGLQAQLMSAAELSLWVRVQGITSSDVQKALWRDRTLIKTWAMRGTLHLLAASEFPLYVAARGAYTIRRPQSWFKYHGVTPAELDAIIDSVPAVLHGSGMTREQLADAVARRARKPKLREVLLSGWGALLKPLAFQGDLCFGPSEGQNVTFVRPGEWIGEWRPLEPDQALKEIARRYLTAYGPATIDDFAHWWGMDASIARRLFKSLADEIDEVEVEGWKAWALAPAVKKMQGMAQPDGVRLLPNFDPYTIALYRHVGVLDQTLKARISRTSGWISPVVLVNGRIEGVWEYEQQRSKVAVKVTMFKPLKPAARRGIEAEADRLGEFLGAEVELAF